MDKNYYEILELSPNASSDDIKRAYFKLVRRYSPEQNPERFQEIREAYENLKTKSENSETSQNKFTLQFPDSLPALQMRDIIDREFNRKNYKMVIKVAEEAIKRFGECQGFLYFLGTAQQMNGKTGKAVKIFEKLTKLYPDHIEFRRQLALAYQDRGFGNKAYVAFNKAYDMGCSDPDFIYLFSRCCEDRGEYKKGIALMEKLVENAKEKPNASIGEMLDAFMGIVIMSVEDSKKSVQKMLLQFHELLQNVSFDLDEYEDEIEKFLFFIGKGVIKYGLYEEESFKQIRSDLRYQGGKDQKKFDLIWDSIAKLKEEVMIHQDSRISVPLKLGFDAFKKSDEENTDEIPSGYLRFLILDAQLCMLEDWPENRKEFEIVREFYPNYYEKLKKFIHKLETTSNIEIFRQHMQKDYDRYELYFNDGYYYQFHPEQKRRRNVTKWDSDIDGTYTRSQRKIGRNEPCPCGSGKKYKNCCGNR
ncbi:hypothetical protein D3Z55_15530 [Clostridiaceae bacterium]|nr:hypothetical protein [Clostridiaceae bacterium]